MKTRTSSKSFRAATCGINRNGIYFDALVAGEYYNANTAASAAAEAMGFEVRGKHLYRKGRRV